MHGRYLSASSRQQQLLQQIMDKGATPQQMQQLVALSNMPLIELCVRNVPEGVIQMVEQNRAVLQQYGKNLHQFSGGLAGDANNASGHDTADMNSRAQSQWQWPSGAGLNINGMGGGMNQAVTPQQMQQAAASWTVPVNDLRARGIPEVVIQMVEQYQTVLPQYASFQQQQLLQQKMDKGATPELIELLVALSNMPLIELCVRNVPEGVIQMVEQNRTVLQQYGKNLHQFSGGLAGDANNASGHDTADMNSRAQSQWQWPSGAGLNINGMGGGMNQAVTPQQMQLAAALWTVPVNELRTRGIPEVVIQMVEQYKAVLPQYGKNLHQFRGGLAGDANNASGHDTADMNSRAQSQGQGSSGAGLNTNGILGGGAASSQLQQLLQQEMDKGVTPELMQLLVALSTLPENELRAGGVPEGVIQMVEQNRAVLQQ
jgi:uncharacterized protein YjeT (DUF2065 family)